MYAGKAGTKTCPPYLAVVGIAQHRALWNGANADHAGVFIGPAGEGHCNKHQIHVLRVSGKAMGQSEKIFALIREKFSSRRLISAHGC